MLQNKIYQNFLIEIFKTFFTIVLGLSLIALTVRAVNFLELIVDNGYPITTYFKYSFLNLFGIAPKFIPLAYLISLIIFILKHINDSEFIILWTSGVMKIKIVNLFILSSFITIFIYLTFTIFLTPYSLNKSRQLLSAEQFNSFLPTIRSQQFTDSFKGFTLIVEKKYENKIENIFLHDTGNNLKNLSSNSTDTVSTTIIAEKGLVDKRKMFLLNGQIITSKNQADKNEIIKFEQLNIDLNNVSTTTIKQPKIQETSTIKLLKCFSSSVPIASICNEDTKKEILPILIRRIILPFYIPVLSLICSILLFKKNIVYSNKALIFISSFTLLVFTELLIRYTGINYLLRYIYIVTPFALSILLYFILILKFSDESKTT
jgi:lipopolysaccharide export LptBFGC system permease protein LptF